jgi:hypothetical protein
MHLRFTPRSQLLLKVKNIPADPAPWRCLAAISPVSQGASGKTYFSGKLWLWYQPSQEPFFFRIQNADSPRNSTTLRGK